MLQFGEEIVLYLRFLDQYPIGAEVVMVVGIAPILILFIFPHIGTKYPTAPLATLSTVDESRKEILPLGLIPPHTPVGKLSLDLIKLSRRDEGRAVCQVAPIPSCIHLIAEEMVNRGVVIHIPL